jgi:hypothetical protein
LPFQGTSGGRIGWVAPSEIPFSTGGGLAFAMDITAIKTRRRNSERFITAAILFGLVEWGSRNVAVT